MIKLEFGGVAQLGERTVRIRKVESSILFVSTQTRAYELVFYKNVFALITKIPESYMLSGIL